MIPSRKTLESLSREYGVPSVDLAKVTFEPDVLTLVPRDLAEKYPVLPIRMDGPALIVAMADPSNVNAVEDLKFVTCLEIEVVVASEFAIRDAIKTRYPPANPVG